MSDCLNMFKNVTKNSDAPGVLVTVARVRGSGPREVGAQMLVTAKGLQGTIGGGHFEYSVIDLAREIISDNDTRSVVQDYPLGPALGQCCGGVVTLLLEPISDALIQHFNQVVSIANVGKTAISIVDLEMPANRMLLSDAVRPVLASSDVSRKAKMLLLNAGEVCQTFKSENDKDYLMQLVRQTQTPLYIYGAGHVGRALVNAILPLNFMINWVDMRTEEFPENVAELPLTQHITDRPVSLAEKSETGAFHLILTHDHQIDFDICEALLRRDDYGYLGMIGSDTKRARFIKRFRNRGISEGQIDKLICPIGIGEIASKRPAEIAISVAVEIIQRQAHISQTIKNNAAEKYDGVCASKN